MDANLSMSDSVEKAKEALESGNALKVFKKFVEINS